MATSLSVSPTQRRIVWGVRILLALAFGAAGIAKLAGVPPMVQLIGGSPIPAVVLGLLSVFAAWRLRPLPPLGGAV